MGTVVQLKKQINNSYFQLKDSVEDKLILVEEKIKLKLESNVDLAQKMTEQAVYIYNNLRTHFSLDLRKPAEVHLNPNIKYKSYRKNNVNLPELTI